MQIKPIAERIKELQSVMPPLRENALIQQLRSEGYEGPGCSRGTIRRLMGVATEKRPPIVQTANDVTRVFIAYQDCNDELTVRHSPQQPTQHTHVAPTAQQQPVQQATRQDAARPEWMPSDEFVRGMVADWRNVQAVPDKPANLAWPDNAQLIPRKPLQLDVNNFLAASDLHCPLQNKRMLDRLARVAEHTQISTLILQGDVFDLDSTSRHGRAEIQAGINRTLEAAGAVLDALAGMFSRIYILPGNHCERVSKKLDEPLSFHYLVRAAVKRARVSDSLLDNAPITTTDYAYLYVGPQDTGWVIGHPTGYARQPVSYSKVAARERRNVLLSHTHLQSMVWSDCGYFLIIDPGHMTEPTMTPYVMKHKGLSRYAEPKAGFTLVRGSVPTIMADGLVRWSDYGCT